MPKKDANRALETPAISLEGVISLLNQCRLFNTLENSSLNRLARVATLQRVRKQELFLRQGQEVNAYYVILKGFVRVFQYSAQGKDFTLKLLRSGDTLGSSVLFYVDPPLSPFCARAITDALLAVFGRREFLSFAVQHPYVIAGIGETLASSLLDAIERIVGLSDDAKNRVISVLLEIAPKFEGNVPFTHQEIGDMAGVTRETTSKILAELSHRGIVSVRYGGITIVHMALLRFWGGTSLHTQSSLFRRRIDLLCSEKGLQSALSPYSNANP